VREISLRFWKGCCHRQVGDMVSLPIYMCSSCNKLVDVFYTRDRVVFCGDCGTPVIVIRDWGKPDTGGE
jgi:DNA-directed RNA polymerase subunit RPC12/RpoP